MSRPYPTASLTIQDCDQAIRDILARQTDDEIDRDHALLEIDRWLDTRLEIAAAADT